MSIIKLVAVFIVALVLFVLPRASAAQTSPPIEWREGITFSRTSVDDDIRSVLRSLLEANGLSAIFRQGVEGTISLRLDKVNPKDIFQQLIVENGLDYSYNPGSRTVTIFRAPASASEAPRRVFITLNHARYAAIRGLLQRFGLGLDGIGYDAATRTISVLGRQDRIDQVGQLVEKLEAAEQQRRESAHNLEDSERRKRRAEIEMRLYEEMLQADVKVIALRFATVGETSRQFHGRTITVPGIAKTLEAILGQLNVSGAAGAAARGGPARSARPGDPAAADREGEQQFLGRMRDLARPTISIDQRTNSVIVRGSPRAIASVEQVVRQLDQPLKMIEIEVVIATASVGVAEELGIRWRGSRISDSGSPRSGAFDSGTSGGRVGNGTADTFDSSGFNALSLLPTAASPNATIAAFVIRGTEGILQAQLRALAEQNRAHILSAPRLVTLDNITARITRSQDLFVQVDTGGDNGQGLEEIQTGLTLEITPSLVAAQDDGSDHLIRLGLTAVNSSPGNGAFGQIDVRSQEVQTEVLVPNGGTYVIGGLFDDTRTEGESGVPLLKDLPILGRLFRTDTSNNTLGETIFFITPRVVDQKGPFQDDIAMRIGTIEYMRRQRRNLNQVADEAMRGTGRVFPNAIRTLEEDE